MIHASLSVHRSGSAEPPGLGSGLAMARAATKGLQVELYGHNLAGPTVQADMRGDCPMTDWERIPVRPGWEPSEEQDYYPVW